eukprot:COSAG01_NODE_11743_length_1868_cov_8.443754_3_plen_101_part_00
MRPAHLSSPLATVTLYNSRNPGRSSRSFLLLLLPLREEAALCFPRGLRRSRGHLPPHAAVLHAHSRVRAVPDQSVSRCSRLVCHVAHSACLAGGLLGFTW